MVGHSLEESKNTKNKLQRAGPCSHIEERLANTETKWCDFVMTNKLTSRARLDGRST